jgi:hypothetical protein
MGESICALATAMSVGYLGYNTIITWIYGWLDSVSASFYKLQNRDNDKSKQGGWFMVFMAFLMACSLGITILTSHWAFFIATSGAAFVLVAAAYNRDKITELVHVIGASALIIGHLLGIALFYGNWWPIGIMGVLFLVGFVKRVLYKKWNIGQSEELFAHSGLWYEHIATVAIIVGHYIQ